jgi:hypothetical protein
VWRKELLKEFNVEQEVPTTTKYIFYIIGVLVFTSVAK